MVLVYPFFIKKSLDHKVKDILEELMFDVYMYAIYFSITVAMYYLRFMQVFFVEKNIGPKVIMITNMVKPVLLISKRKIHV